tara:strand:- start:1502 stop:1876 length:375 start_codon:yes stop_codon:yes gene_type:complete
MWLFTKYGFFSVVCARQEENSPLTIDLDKVMVRARKKKHLQNLKHRFIELIGNCQIIMTSGRDYPCRMVIAKDVWNKICFYLSNEIDYNNFKNEVDKTQEDRDLNECLHEIWSIMFDYMEKPVK